MEIVWSLRGSPRRPGRLSGRGEGMPASVRAVIGELASNQRWSAVHRRGSVVVKRSSAPAGGEIDERTPA